MRLREVGSEIQGAAQLLDRLAIGLALIGTAPGIEVKGGERILIALAGGRQDAVDAAGRARATFPA